MTDIRPLAEDFPAAGRADWMALVEKALKGAPFDSLVTRSDDDIAIDPLAAVEGTRGPIAGRAAGAPWDIVQRIDHPDPAQANALALDDLAGGATGLALVFRDAPSAYGAGLHDPLDLERVLEGVALDLISLSIEGGSPAAVAGLITRRGAAPKELSLGLDPLGRLAASGAMPAVDLDPLRGLGGPLFRADGRPYHNAGASEAQELACILATALAYLRRLDADGHGMAEAAERVSLMLAADAEKVLTIAKFRAGRLLWRRVIEECGAGDAAIRIEAETSWRMLARLDPWTNLLRCTIAAFAAGAGGADAITVLPFTQALGLPDAHARRLARNTQHLLLEESALAGVTDPGAGAGAVEVLTDALCAESWDLFREIEGRGGMEAALRAGFVRDAIAPVAEARGKRLATGARQMVGTNAFPLPAEVPVPVLAPLLPPPLAASGALAARRLAEPFERLRAASAAFAARNGEWPRVLVLERAGARDTGLARDWLAAGGIDAIEAVEAVATPDEDGHETASLFTESRTEIVCLCGAGMQDARGLVGELKQAGARAVYLVIASAPDEAARATGADGFVYDGMDAIAALHGLHWRLGIG